MIVEWITAARKHQATSLMPVRAEALTLMLFPLRDFVLHARSDFFSMMFCAGLCGAQK